MIARPTALSEIFDMPVKEFSEIEEDLINIMSIMYEIKSEKHIGVV